MKIAYIVPMLAPYAISRFRELAKIKDVELHVIVEMSTSQERPGWKFQKIEGVHMYLLNGIKHVYDVRHETSGYTIQNAHFFSKGLKKLVDRIQPDFCIVCNTTQLMGLIGFRKYKVGVVVEDTLRAEEGRKRVYRIIKRFFLRTADFYLPYSTDAVRFLKKNGIEKRMYSSSWSVNTSLFQQISTEEIKKARNKFNMAKDKTVYLIASSLIPRKGIKQFLEAWSEMDEYFQENSELHIIGEGPLKNELIHYIKHQKLENVHLRGHFPYEEVALSMQCADIFILPTLEDLCSLVVFEALASHLPVLTSIYNGAKDWVIEDENGYIFDSESKTSIISALKKIHNADLEKMSERSAAIINNFTDQKVMMRFYETLQEIAANGLHN